MYVKYHVTQFLFFCIGILFSGNHVKLHKIDSFWAFHTKGPRELFDAKLALFYPGYPRLINGRLSIISYHIPQGWGGCC